MKLLKESILRVLVRRIFFLSIQDDTLTRHGGNHITMHASRTIVLYISNLFSVVCQLYLIKMGEKAKKTLKECYWWT